MTLPTKLGDKVDHLKTLLLRAKDFSEPMNYFLDELTADSAFLDTGKMVKDKAIKERVLAVLDVMCREIALPEQQGLPAPAPGKLLPLMWHKRFSLGHAGCSIRGGMGLALYFKDLDMGLISQGWPQFDDRVFYSRFTMQEAKNPTANYQFDRSGHMH